MRDLRLETAVASVDWRTERRGGRLCSSLGCFEQTTHLKPFCRAHLRELPAIQEVLARWRWLKSPAIQQIVSSLSSEPFAVGELALRLDVLEETALRYLGLLEGLGCVYHERGKWHYSGL